MLLSGVKWGPCGRDVEGILCPTPGRGSVVSIYSYDLTGQAE